MTHFRRRSAPKVTTLREWQLPHAEHLAEVIAKNGAAADMSDTGTGKSYVAMFVAKALKRRILAIGPKTSTEKYLDVAVQMRSGFFLSCGWEEAKSKGFRYNRLVFEKTRTGERILREVHWKVPDDVLIWFDEGHRGKGYQNGSVTQNGLLMCGARGIPSLTSSATIAVSAKDMYSSGFLLGLHGRYDFKDFVERYGPYNVEEDGKVVPVAREGLMALHREMFPSRGGRLRVADIPGFPKNNVFAELITVENAGQLSSWREEVDGRVMELNALGQRMKALAARQKYLQAAEMARLPAMIEKAKDMEEEGNSVAMFVNYRETLFAAVKLLQRETAFVVGEQKMEDRLRLIERFQKNELHFIICTHGAGGVSIDLHDLYGRPRVSLISPTDNPTEFKQTLGRLPREGARSAVFQYVLFMAGVEEDVYQNVTNKIGSIDTLNDGDLKL